MSTLLKRILSTVVGVMIFVLVNIAIADHLPLRYNVGATLALFAIGGIWLYAKRRRRRHFYEPFNGR